MKLSALLLAGILFSTTLNASLEQIKIAKHKKELQLSKLGKKIFAKQEYIELLHKKVVSVASKEAENFTAEQSKEYEESIMIFIKKFKENINVSNFLLLGLFKKTKHEDHPVGFEFDAVKFSFVNIINEYRLLKELVKKYEKISQERCEYKQQLLTLPLQN